LTVQEKEILTLQYNTGLKFATFPGSTILHAVKSVRILYLRSLTEKQCGKHMCNDCRQTIREFAFWFHNGEVFVFEALFTGFKYLHYFCINQWPCFRENKRILQNVFTTLVRQCLEAE